MKKFGKEFEKKIETVNDNKKINYGKDYKKNRFESNEDLPLNNMLKFHLMTTIIKCILQEDGTFPPQFFLDDCL